MDKLAELRWILGELQGSDDSEVYLLEHVIEHKDYSRRDVEEWGREVECRALVNKIDDLLHVRLLKAAQKGLVDKGIAIKRLSAKYEYNDKVDMSVKGDFVVKIMAEGAGL